ncbi:MAG TPA: glycine--tRNA ligase subunit beta [Acidobacteriaceae bacterium]|nr:glycine--tRNA ligase subunit beta [Acidobacteriaceae bacterium]
MAEFLFEIGLEEVPARMIAGAEKELRERVVAMLERERLVRAGVAAKSFSTPRRLAVWVGEVAARQADVREEMTGPAVKIAYKDGVPTAAAQAFAKKAGVEVSALKTVQTPKGEYLAATAVKAGRAAAEVIAEEMPKELAGIYWAKNMVWRAGRPERFVRPVKWLVCLLGNDTVPVSFAGKTAGRESRGHRVLHGDEPVPIVAPGEYEPALMTAKVMADVEARRHKIRKALDHVTRAGGRTSEPALRWREDHGLVDTVTHLTEWPTVVMGGFEPEFLPLPEEVLVTVMRDHQKYFAVERDGKLAAHFLTVLNTETDAKGEAVIRHGNEKVLHARFTDAKFFWEFDQRVPLTERVALLEKVTFQKELGSYAAKSERVRAVAKKLAEKSAKRSAKLDAAALDDAARLAKTDLTTDMVKEFTELQGEVGGLYARAQRHAEPVAAAIYDQYRPAGMEDRIPRTAEGQLLAISDKADTIAGMFGLGLEPTGSKDPFALRRAANGIVKILAEGGLPLTLGDVADAATADEKVRVKMEVFFAERLEFYLREAKGQAYDVVKAVLAAGANDVRDAVARAEAVTAVRGSEDFAAVSAAFKRMKNILAQAAEKGIKIEHGKAHAGEVHATQRQLADAAGKIGAQFKANAARHEYVPAMELIAGLRGPVDAFFDQVMVMDPDAAVRNARLALLAGLVETFSKIADFSEIVTAG